MNILAFGASSSSSSINQKLAVFAANQLEGATITTIDLNDLEMPIFSTDREKATGIPQEAKTFKAMMQAADGIILSFAEHNGSYSAAFKNVMDWASRLEGKLWLEKPMLLMATSPGGRGGQTILNHAVNGFPHMGAQVTSHFSLPSFYQNFSDETGITDTALDSQFQAALQSFTTTIAQYEPQV